MEKEKVLMKVGTKIREIRISKRLTQLQVADRCNWDFTAISRIESGRSNMTLETLIKICDALEVKLVDLFVDID